MHQSQPSTLSRRTTSTSDPQHLLLIPNAPWDTNNVDFIVELPESEGKDAIMVVVDSVTKQGHFIDTVTMLSTAGTARLYVQHIWKHHGLPKKAVSNRGLQFVVEFMKELYQLLPTTLKVTDKRKGLIKNWSSTSDSSLIKDRIIELDFFHLQSSSTMYTL